MSLDLSHIQNNLTKGMYSPRGKPFKVKRYVTVSKTTHDVSTQTTEDLVLSKNCISFKSQSC